MAKEVLVTRDEHNSKELDKLTLEECVTLGNTGADVICNDGVVSVIMD